MIALFSKELRGHLPLLALMAFVFGADFLYRPLAGRVDEISWVEQSGQLLPGEGVDTGVFLMILGLVAAYSAFPREHDEKTIEFLYGLPLSRPRIFLAKASAIWTVLAVGVLLDQLAGAVAQALNPQSFTGEQWRFELAAQVASLNGFFFVVIVAHGLLISFLRRFGLVLYAVAGLAVVLIKKHLPAYTYLDPNELLDLRYRGTELELPWQGILVHGTAALAAAALAYALWMGPAERMTQLYTRLQARLAGRVALGCTTAGLIGFGVAWMVWMVAEDAGDMQPVRYREFFPVSAETRWYDFTYPDNLSRRAHQLIAEADRVYEEVAGALQVEPGFRIDADLTDAGVGHLGIAQGGVLRIALESLSPEDALRTLYHETVHAFQSHLGGRDAAQHKNSLRFFVEGSAEYVTMELLPDPETRRAHRRLAVAAVERHGVRFEELVDNAAFVAVHDTALVYVLGETWTAALVEACGPSAPGDVFRALGRDDAPEGLDGPSLWQDTLQAAGCALEPVVASWSAAMSELADSERQFLQRLPRLGGGVVGREGGELLFRAGFDRPVTAPAEEYFLRVRQDPGTPDEQTYTVSASLAPGASNVELRLPAGRVGSGTFELQFGQSINGSIWPFFEDWQVGSFDGG